MKKITFMTNDNVVINKVFSIVTMCKNCYSLNIDSIEVPSDDKEEPCYLELVEGFDILVPGLEAEDNRHLLRDAIAKHISECQESVETNANHRFSAQTASYWFFPYAAIRAAGIAKCNLNTFVEQMAVWFPALIRDIRITKKHARKLEGKFGNIKIGDWGTSPNVKYQRRKLARSIAYDGIFCTMNKLKKQMFLASVENS